MENEYEVQYKKMTETPVNSLIFKLSVPTVVSMLISSIYNLADAYFVGQIGTSASGAIGIVLVIQSIIQAFGFTFGHGAGSIISRKLGEGDSNTADRLASTGFACAVFFGFVILGFGMLFLNDILRILGSTPTILPFANSYAKYILYAAPFMASSCVLNNIMRYEGHAFFAMIGLASGGILNIALDPLFMFTFDMGIEGAGIATALSQLISFGILLFMFLSGRTQTKISFRNITRDFSEVRQIFFTGTPNLIRQGLNSVSTMFLNNAASGYGDAAIAAMSIVGRICMFIASIMVGIGQGMQPVAAFNYGAHKYKRVKQAFHFTLWFGEALLAFFAFVVFIVSADIITLFRDDPDVIAFGVTALRFQCVSMLFQPLGVCANMFFQSIGESAKAAFLSTLRSGMYFVPLIILLPRFMDVLGVQSAQAISDFLTFFTSLPMIMAYFRRKRFAQ